MSGGRRVYQKQTHVEKLLDIVCIPMNNRISTDIWRLRTHTEDNQPGSKSPIWEIQFWGRWRCGIDHGVFLLFLLVNSMYGRVVWTLFWNGSSRHLTRATEKPGQRMNISPSGISEYQWENAAIYDQY